MRGVGVAWVPCALMMLVVTACDTGAHDLDVRAPSLETAPASLTADQREHCERGARDGRELPWWCGGREGRLAPPFANACDDRQWVGLRIEPIACPAAPSRRGTWHVSEPFARSRDVNLRRICQYTWQPAFPERPQPDVAALPDRPELRLERDCDVVGAHALPEEVNDALAASWSSQVELPDWSEAAPFEVAPVQVAVIDAGYGGMFYGGHVPQMEHHAVAVSSVIRNIACPDRGAGAFCNVKTPNYPAMRYIRRGVPGELGGRFGTQLEYATAVANAVDDWLQTPLAQRPRNLVLNLSLGWDGEYDVTQSARVPGAVALWATRYAACRGALLIAAAGNRADESDAGPLYPAAWEALPRGCDEPIRPGIYSPLVHAVGGVDGRDGPLALARAGGTPRLVAAGSLIVVPADTLLGDSLPATELMSGTSMSAAAVSGAAALIWSVRPDFGPDQVMHVLHRTGEPLGLPAEFGMQGQIQQQRRLSVARAFARVCPEGVAAGACPGAQSRPTLPDPRPAGGDATPAFDDIVAFLYGDAEVGAEAPGAENPPAAPTSYFEPFTVPQPGAPNCPVCGFLGTTLHGKLDESLAHLTLGTPVAKVVRFDGTSVDIKLGPLPVNGPFQIDLSTPLGGKAPLKGWLQLPVTEDGKTVLTSSELFIQP